MIAVDGGEVWADDSGGDGPPLALLHPGVGDSRIWDPVWPALAASYRVIRYDARGFGRSPAPQVTFSLLADLIVVLDHYGLDRVAIVGCSQGGGSALALALAQPARVSALVLLCPGIPGYPWPEEEPDELEAEYEHALDAGDARAQQHQRGHPGRLLQRQAQRGAAALAASHHRGAVEAVPVQDRDQVGQQRELRPRRGRPAEAAGVVPDNPVGRGERRPHRFPDARVADARVQQDKRQAVASAVVGPYLATLNGDHRLTHESRLSHTSPAVSRRFTSGRRLFVSVPPPRCRSRPVGY